MFAFAVLMLGASDEGELPVIRPGDTPLPAPAFELADLGGDVVKLADVDAPVTLLYFWSKYRECGTDLKLLDALQEKYGDEGLKVITVVYSSGSRDDVTEFLADLDVDLTTVMCPRATLKDYDVATFPTTFLLDRAHNIRYWMYGILVDWHWDRLIRESFEADAEAA